MKRKTRIHISDPETIDIRNDPALSGERTTITLFTKYEWGESEDRIHIDRHLDGSVSIWEGYEGGVYLYPEVFVEVLRILNQPKPRKSKTKNVHKR